MISQKSLARRFARGDDAESIPKASNIEVESAEGSDDEFEAYIVAYNWAMYAGRTSEGSVVLFDGWYGYSKTSSKQIGYVRSGILQAKRLGEVSDYRSSDLDPKVRSEAHAERNNSRSMHRSNGYPA